MTPKILIAFLLLALVGGCDFDSSNGGSANMDEIERIKAEAHEQKVRPDNIVERLDRIDLFDFEFLTQIREDKDPWVRVLHEAVEGRELSSLAQMNAGLLLLELGEPTGTTALVEALRGGDHQLWKGVFASLSARGMLPSKLPLDAEVFAPAVLPCLDDPSSHLGGIALDVAGSYQMQQTFPRLRELLAHGDLGVRAKSCSWLLMAGQYDSVIFDAAEQLLADEEFLETRAGWPAQNLIQRGLAVAAEGQDATAKERALKLLERFVRDHLGSRDNSAADYVWRAVETIVKQQGIKSLPLLEAVYECDTSYRVRGSALRHLAKLQGKDSLPKVLESLRDDPLKEDAAKALVILAREHQIAGQVDALVMASEGGKNTALGAIAEALMASNEEEASDALRSLAKRLDPVDAMKAHWHLEKLKPKRVIARLVESEVLPPMPQPDVEQLVAKWKGAAGAYGFLAEVFHSSKSVLWFDTEAGVVPVHHDKLVRRFAEASRGIFRPEAVVEKWNRKSEQDFQGDYDVQFVHRGRAFKFKAQYSGDWYDVGSVVKAINGALEDAGARERFFGIHTGDQTAFFVFADAKGFESVRAELAIPVESYAAKK